MYSPHSIRPHLDRELWKSSPPRRLDQSHVAQSENPQRVISKQTHLAQAESAQWRDLLFARSSPKIWRRMYQKKRYATYTVTI
jgi:hypothetical protein